MSGSAFPACWAWCTNEIRPASLENEADRNTDRNLRKRPAKGVSSLNSIRLDSGPRSTLARGFPVSSSPRWACMSRPGRRTGNATLGPALSFRRSGQSHLRDSNPGLQLYESCALPTELRWQVSIRVVPAVVLKKSSVLPGQSGTLPLELRRRHRSKLLSYRRGARGVKVDQPGWNVRGHSWRLRNLYLGPRAMARW